MLIYFGKFLKFLFVLFYFDSGIVCGGYSVVNNTVLYSLLKRATTVLNDKATNYFAQL